MVKYEFRGFALIEVAHQEEKLSEISHIEKYSEK